MSQKHEVRAYINAQLVNGLMMVMIGGFVILQLISIPEGTFLKTLPMSIVIYIILSLIWLSLRKGTYIAVDTEKNTDR